MLLLPLLRLCQACSATWRREPLCDAVLCCSCSSRGAGEPHLDSRRTDTRLAPGKVECRPRSGGGWRHAGGWRLREGGDGGQAPSRPASPRASQAQDFVLSLSRAAERPNTLCRSGCAAWCTCLRGSAGCRTPLSAGAETQRRRLLLMTVLALAPLLAGPERAAAPPHARQNSAAARANAGSPAARAAGPLAVGGCQSPVKSKDARLKRRVPPCALLGGTALVARALTVRISSGNRSSSSRALMSPILLSSSFVVTGV